MADSHAKATNLIALSHLALEIHDQLGPISNKTEKEADLTFTVKPKASTTAEDAYDVLVDIPEGFTLGTTIYGGYAPGEFVILSLLQLAIVSAASLYPAWFAARLEPIDALKVL